MLVPATVEWQEAFGPYRRNSDRINVTGTDRQWIYGSGVLGIERLHLILDVMRPLEAKRTAAVTVDGVLNDAEWGNEPTHALPNAKSRIFLRHDETTLYIGVSREPMVSKLGTPLPWQTTTEGEDAEVWKDDAIEIFLADRAGRVRLHVGLSASGARYDARAVGTDAEDAAWNAPWTSATKADESGLSWELAIPLAAIAEAGIPVDQLALNVMVDQSDTRADVTRFVGAEGRNWNVKHPTSEALFSLGSGGRAACTNFAPLGLSSTPAFPMRRFVLKLHFAELDDSIPGRRRFDVLANGEAVLTDFDITAEGGSRAAVVRTIDSLMLGEALQLEFRSRAEEATAETVPVLSGVELFEVTEAK
jgi:hypothetical protein